MASRNKKNKARNSYMENGGERRDDKMKRINYYKKRDRQKLKVRADMAQWQSSALGKVAKWSTREDALKTGSIPVFLCNAQVGGSTPSVGLVTPYEGRRPTGDVPAQSVRKPAQMGDK